MISYGIHQQNLMVSDRVFRPVNPSRLSAEWPDPLGFNEPAEELRSMHLQLLGFVRTHRPTGGSLLDAMESKRYRIAEYFGLGTSESIEDMTMDLRWFAQRTDGTPSTHQTFLAIFDDVTIRDEDDFEHQLWSQIIGMLNIDSMANAMTAFTDATPDDEQTLLGIGGHDFRVVTLHPYASESRHRFAYPTLVLSRSPELSQAC